MTGAARILIVDDEPNVRLVFRTALEAVGYAVDEVADGVAALDRLRESPADLVLLDLQMPRLDGMATLAPAAGGGRRRPRRDHHGARQRPRRGGRHEAGRDRLPGQAADARVPSPHGRGGGPAARRGEARALPSGRRGGVRVALRAVPGDPVACQAGAEPAPVLPGRGPPPPGAERWTPARPRPTT